MATPVFSPASFITGEIAPAMFGHTDLARFHSGAATMRNMWPRITGGAYSRAGTLFVGFSRQIGRAFPPRLIPFQFSVLQGRILEFGNYYMRVIADGGYVTDLTLQNSAATNTNPVSVTFSSSGGETAAPINTGVFQSYTPGELITLAGGVFSLPSQLLVETTKLITIIPQASSGSGYAPGDNITLQGGVSSTNPVIHVATTQVTSVVINNAGTGGKDGNAVVTGTTGTGTLFTANVLISGGIIVAILSIANGGSYTANPSNLAAEPVTGGGLSGATLTLTMGPNTITVINSGVFNANPIPTLTQLSTTGSGTGAIFHSPLMGIAAVAVVTAGAYSVFPTNPVGQASTLGGSGLGATFNVVWTGTGGTSFNIGDWLVFSGVGGMTQLNGRTLVVAGKSGNTYTFSDPCGNSLDATSWGVFTSGGTASRIYTVPSPYAEADLKWLKFTQSADVMSICCVNQDTLAEYPPYDLERHSDTNWIFNLVTFKETIAAPGACFLSPSFNYAILFLFDPKDYPNPVTTSYAYCVTAVNPTDGTESVASPVGSVVGAVAISAFAGSISVSWPAVPGAQSYNVYKAQPITTWGFYPPPIPIGSLFGFAARALGTSWSDNNVVPDFEQSPPTHQNPFARGAITQVNPILTGNLTPGLTTVTINSSTGSGAVILPIANGSGYPANSGGFQVVPGGSIVGYYILAAGEGYLPTDTVTVNNGGGATAALVVGPNSGTYPSLPSYYQQRRIYASTINDPDTYWMSVVGNFKNFDTRIPVIDSDAIEGSPWTQQVNGIQWMVPMPGGIITLTGQNAWIVGGNGSGPVNPQPITPSSQQAQPQNSNGASPFVPPVKIDWDLVYVQEKGSIYRDITLSNYFVNYYTGRDITINSPHLFLNYTTIQHAWQEEPYKLLWSVRSDGAALSMTYYKPEQVLGWARHDTFGQFCTVASITEPPVDAVYFGVLRPICPNGQCACCIERMDNRLWRSVEDVWAVDCALRYPMPAPPAILNISSPDGNGAVVGVTAPVGGQNYGAATFATVIDNGGQGTGTGAIVALTIHGGVIVNYTVSVRGSGYTRPQLIIEDPSGQGSGASAVLTLQTQAVFLTNAPVFSVSMVGYVIRAAGGVATITQFVNSNEVIADFIAPTTAFMPELNQGNYIPNVASGQWTLTEPAQVIGGLWHLVGAQVTGLADGEVITPRMVDDNGDVTLDAPATAITIGLSFTAQLQSMYVDVGEPTVQGQRKAVTEATVRVDASRDFFIGTNQVDGSTLSPLQLGPVWNNMLPVQNQAQAPYTGGPIPLWTGDVRQSVTNGQAASGVVKPGQVALMQTNPLPLNVLALIPDVLSGDTSEQHVSPRKNRQGREEG